uniref:Amino acid transporter transmembrane domain-containing protein n=1 Tax=Ditylum brightwellii TaxID=49249 RepID=A0A7S4WB93_9STRA|mmetsp:Transcript_15331/g.22006  ORF Transcript_15331/g.22006 Transcript_15331/m.22006 type:complete len:461 (+) Transcript_15331:55-1437(+)
MFHVEGLIYLLTLFFNEPSHCCSTLRYDISSEHGKMTATHAPGSVMGAAALVAGTTIGAGIIALPTATASAGFLPSSAGLCLAWAYMTATGLLISELSINRIGETGRPGIGILDLYKNSLGKGYSAIAMAAFFFLHYSVMVAYFAKAGSYVCSFLTSAGLGGWETPAICQLLFAGTIGSFLYLMKPKEVEKVNNFLVLGVAATFVSIISIGAQTADFGALVALENQHPEEVVNAFPILFLVLVFHNVVPTVVRQLEGDRQKITTAIVSGTVLPLLMFLSWNAVIIGNVIGSPDIMATDFDPIALIENGQNGDVLGGLVSIFTELAIVTSLVGFVYGLVDAITDVAGIPSSGPVYEKWRPALYAGVFVPPLVFSMINPYVFMDALEYGGAFGVSTLFLVLPAIMIWKERYGDEQKPITVKPMVPGGKITLGSIWKAAGTLIVEQGAEKLGIIDFIHDAFTK